MIVADSSESGEAKSMVEHGTEDTPATAEPTPHGPDGRAGEDGPPSTVGSRTPAGTPVAERALPDVVSHRTGPRAPRQQEQVREPGRYDLRRQLAPQVPGAARLDRRRILRVVVRLRVPT